MLFSGEQPSKKFELSKKDLSKAGQVVLWSGASAIIGALITLLPQINFPVQWLFLVPLVNTLLVTLKKFIVDNLK